MKKSDLIFTSVDEAQLKLLDILFKQGDHITTRGLNTLEVCNVNLSIINPRNRRTYNPIRKWKFPLAIGEFAWHISGSNNLDFISYYSRQWEKFSEDGKLITQSCYGHKIFKEDISGESQWDRLKKLLKKDIFSRRAVLDLYDSDNGIDYFSKDVSCVCTVQFLIRNGKLDAIVNMRSNDIIWGLPYDIFLFTMLQELLSLELGFELGAYYHNVGSMHIYDRHFELGKKMLEYEPSNPIEEQEMQDPYALKLFLKYEQLIRVSDIELKELQSLSLHSYWSSLLISLWNYKAERRENKRMPI